MRRTRQHPIHNWLIGSVLLVLVASGHAFAQTQVSGSITGPEGTAFDRVVVTATGENNRVVRGTVDASGQYTLTLDPGTYTITAVGPGLGRQVFENVQVAEGQTATQDVAFQAAQPYCIVEADAPIPLTEGIDSAAFAEAQEIQINAGANIVEGLDRLNDWRGAATASGRVKVMYSEQGLHLAADVTFARPNVNFGSDAELWQGNSLEILFQDDPYNTTRSALDPMHNFRLVIGLGEQPRWRFGNALDQEPAVGGTTAPITEHVSVQNREDNMGNLVRANIPWGLFMTGGDTPTAITPPQDNAMAAMNIIINNTLPEATAEAPGRQFSLSWSGLPGSTTNPSALVPVQFCPEPESPQ